MAKEISLDDVKSIRIVNDKPIRFLFFAEATANFGIIFFAFFYPSKFLSTLFNSDHEITPMTTFILSWWNSWVILITGLMYAAVPSKYNTPTLTAGLIHVRRFIYWALLSSEVLLIILLVTANYKTIFSIGFAFVLLLTIIGRLFVLFPKKAWFGTVLIEPMSKKEH